LFSAGLIVTAPRAVASAKRADPRRRDAGRMMRGMVRIEAPPGST
jgi:hypothetical protein